MGQARNEALAEQGLGELEAQFFFIRELPDEGELSVKLSQLFECRHVDMLLTNYGKYIRALDEQAPATYFSSWLGTLCAAQQHMISRHDAAFDFSPGNLTANLYLKEGRPMFGFRLHDARTLSVPEGDRTEWRRQVLSALYGETLRPLLASLAQAAGLDAGQLWGQIATRMYYARDMAVAQADSEELRAKLTEDFQALLSDLPPDVFGRPRHPLDVKFRYVDDPRKPGEQLRMKVSCCLAYKTDTDHGYCYTCPRMSSAEREERKLKLLAGAK
ncbi:ferric iron reductase [Paenibacillus sp. MZ04-78.2]|uniref:ferric iron reductase n=1 Tax=Paenibacillus sp. MZ04-78.2 TaxID=2962034 RepID=UPI0020B7B5E2|nr:ferric iron reductase [Paenibacillus sp. MZ04-78.2]MCP3773058.1 ferric iron reductase [Paenibacillus sp. MZ04-78.2]